MSAQGFKLKPFDKSHASTACDIEISGNIQHQGDQLIINYIVTGDLKQIKWPTVNTNIAPKELWKHSCFELFISCIDSCAYEEYNFNNQRAWYSFQFSGYRQADDEALPNSDNNIKQTSPHLQFEAKDSDVQMLVELPLTTLYQSKPIQIGLSVVIEDKQQNFHYFALCHKGAKPDFHLRDSFTLEISSRQD